MKTQLLIALTCSSLAFADRGNNHSNSASEVSKGNDFSNAAIYVDHPADTTKGNDFSNGKAKSKKGNDFSNGASGSGGTASKAFWSGSANTVNLQPPEAIG